MKEVDEMGKEVTKKFNIMREKWTVNESNE